MFDSLVCTRCDIKKAWSHSGAHWWRSTGRSLLSQRWADYQLWNNSRLALPAAQNCGQACAPTSRGLPVCSTDWMSWFLVVIRRSRRQKRHYLVVCFQHVLLLHDSDVPYRTMCLCRTAVLHCWGGPKVFCLWTLWHWGVRHCFKPPQHFSFHFSTKLCSAGTTGITFVAWQR